MATDLGQPDLVYKFMDVAHHAAAMKSKRGAAFGVASIAAQSLERLAPHVGALLPKLYRYSCATAHRAAHGEVRILRVSSPLRFLVRADGMATSRGVCSAPCNGKAPTGQPYAQV